MAWTDMTKLGSSQSPSLFVSTPMLSGKLDANFTLSLDLFKSVHDGCSFSVTPIRGRDLMQRIDRSAPLYCTVFHIYRVPAEEVLESEAVESPLFPQCVPTQRSKPFGCFRTLVSAKILAPQTWTRTA